jgi:hypothetical protein
MTWPDWENIKIPGEKSVNCFEETEDYRRFNTNYDQLTTNFGQQ